MTIRRWNAFRRGQSARTWKSVRTGRRTRLPPEREESGSPRSTVEPSGFESGNHRPRGREPRLGTKTGTFRTAEGRSRSPPSRSRGVECGLGKMGPTNWAGRSVRFTRNVNPGREAGNFESGDERRTDSTPLLDATNRDRICPFLARFLA